MRAAALVVLATLTLLNVLALIAGAAPIDVYSTLFQNTLSSGYGIGQVLFKATPYLFLGIAASLAFRTGVLNIGLEGQLVIGSFLMGIAGAALPPGLGVLGAILVCLAGAAGGAFWAAIPAWLKARFAAPEVMTTIMLNFVAAFAANFFVRYAAVSESTHTRELPQSFLLHRFFGSELNSALFVAIVLAALLAWILFRTRLGFRLRALGDNAHAAALYGIESTRLSFATFCASGAIAGLAAMAWVLGSRGYHEDGFSGGIGFTSLGVALLGKSHPLGVIPAALLFGLFSYGTLAINTLVPKEMVDVLIASVMLLMLTLQAGKRA